MINLWRSIRFTIVFAILLGVAYPLVMVGIGNLVFPFQAQGSMMHVQGRIVGSKLIAQSVTRPGLFHPRPSVGNYAGNASGGSNLGPTSKALLAEVKGNLAKVEQQNTGVQAAGVPTSMVQSSGSGLDPDITIRDAQLQVPRIAKATGLTATKLDALIQANERHRLLGIWGNSYVNVLTLNIAIGQYVARNPR